MHTVTHTRHLNDQRKQAIGARVLGHKDNPDLRQPLHTSQHRRHHAKNASDPVWSSGRGRAERGRDSSSITGVRVVWQAALAEMKGGG